MKKLIEIKKIRKEFGKKNKKIIALDEVSFDIFENENVAFIGPNGAGKTTLVEILANINKPTSGEIKYNLGKNKSINKLIGIQFQDSFYPNGLSVKGIIKFIVSAYDSKISKKELDNLIKVFGVKEFYTKNARSLSGGQSQRLNVLLALLHKPKLVFLDELSTGLDITIRNEIKKFIKEYAKKNNITIVLISHDMNEIEYLADRVIIINHGKIIHDLKIKEIKNKTLEEFVTNLI